MAGKSTKEALDTTNRFEFISGMLHLHCIQEENMGRNDGPTLGMHVNSDELMVLGSVHCFLDFYETKYSTNIWVRHMAMVEVISFPISVMINNTEKTKEEENRVSEVAMILSIYMSYSNRI